MLTDQALASLLLTVPAPIRERIGTELVRHRVYEAERIMMEQLGPDRADEAHEAIATLVRTQMRVGASWSLSSR